MTRRGREQLYQRACAEPGCVEVIRFTYRTRAEYLELERCCPRRCVRHTHPEQTLSRTRVSAGASFISDGEIWRGGPGLQSGLLHGPGFKAYAKDFPPGTAINITATILERPEEKQR